MKIAKLAVLCSAVMLISDAVVAQEALTPKQRQSQQNEKTFQAYIPQHYSFFEAVKGDLNKDGVQDAVLIVKATDPKALVEDEYRGTLDRNRRGIIVLLGQKGNSTYKQFLQNLNCFSSDQEDGGVYYPPELVPEIKKGLLELNYQHGRYGYWVYKFRLQNQDMRLIGYDQFSHSGPLLESKTSINLLTGKRIYSKNLSTDPEGKPKFKETHSIHQQAPIYLSKVKDFDELTF
ncbi:hypothetical protein BS636_08365 [Acinetobacter sp. LoGeW2-3]|uniref:hypothetical protein n=1 Tax=Acinetobacter sp. LoGeW2-3 TaxID=1808001 RepID=UPI000C05B14F|nr:hypothetical protein [Acinetobacter sp. LoGeW2-3]ATO19665.1 hypothetical protein BS636_08365 [Acinetobacter sp. LoGeW2-3]